MRHVAILALTALAGTTGPGLAGLTTNSGPHGFTEILYAYTSSFANNGQNFAGLSANTPFYNVTTAVAMVLGRFALAIPALALAGHFARQGVRLRSLGTLPTDGPALRDGAGGHGADRGRPDLLPGAGPRADRGATPPGPLGLTAPPDGGRGRGDPR